MMNKIHSVYLMVILTVFSSCRKDSNFFDGKMYMLIVDFETYNFEGGTRFNLSGKPTTSVPQISYDYQSPGDFGGIQLYHTPDSMLLFDGTIVWSGLGKMLYPTSIEKPNKYDLSADLIEMIDSSHVHANFEIPYGQVNYEAIWNTISQLKLVQDEYGPDFHIEVFCYTPSVGFGDPEDWDYFIFFYG